ncbi:MAG: N-acetylmuramoyl-L-alanine amidase, partial [Pseudomonadota bacterium]
MKILASFIMAIWVGMLAGGVGWAATPDISGLMRAKSQLLSSASRKKLHDNWTACIGRFMAFHDQNPTSPSAAQALLEAGDLYARLSRLSGLAADVQGAEDCLTKVVKEYSGGPAAPAAQYALAQLYSSTGRPAEGLVALAELRRAYPDSPQAKGQAKGVAPESPSAEKSPARSVQRTDSTAVEGGAGARGVATVQNVRSWSSPGHTRVVIDMDDEAEFKEFLVPAAPDARQPRRLCVDIQPAYRARTLTPEMTINDGLVLKVRAAQYTDDVVRVVLEIPDFERCKVYPLRDPYRVVIDVMGKETPITAEPAPPTRPVEAALAEKTSESRVPLSKAPEAPPAVLPPPAPVKPGKSLAAQLGLAVSRVVIDPGHGGKDPGALGPNGEKEKDIVLQIARDLARLMRNEIGCEVLMTRDSDVFIPLGERTEFANQHKADLFISVHANACPDR